MTRDRQLPTNSKISKHSLKKDKARTLKFSQIKVKFNNTVLKSKNKIHQGINSKAI